MHPEFFWSGCTVLIQSRSEPVRYKSLPRIYDSWWKHKIPSSPLFLRVVLSVQTPVGKEHGCCFGTSKHEMTRDASPWGLEAVRSWRALLVKVPCWLSGWQSRDACSERISQISRSGRKTLQYSIHSMCQAAPSTTLGLLDSSSSVISNASHSQRFFPDGVWLMAYKPFDREVKARSEQLLWIESACTTRSPSECP